jgi:hypothetical protein
MGCFSFICKESGLPVASDSFSGDAVRLYLLKNGKVIEEMRGHYDSYGRVFKDRTYEDSFEWKMHWSDVCDMMFNDNKGDGIAVVLEKYFTGKMPIEQSEGDPDQGWGKRNGGGKIIKDAIHIIY